MLHSYNLHSFLQKLTHKWKMLLVESTAECVKASSFSSPCMRRLFPRYSLGSRLSQLLSLSCFVFSLIIPDTHSVSLSLSPLYIFCCMCPRLILDGEHRLVVQLRNRGPSWVSVCRVQGAAHSWIRAGYRAEPQNQGELHEHTQVYVWRLTVGAGCQAVCPCVVLSLCLMCVYFCFVAVCMMEKGSISSHWSRHDCALILRSSLKSSKCHSPQNVIHKIIHSSFTQLSLSFLRLLTSHFVSLSISHCNSLFSPSFTWIYRYISVHLYTSPLSYSLSTHWHSSACSFFCRFLSCFFFLSFVFSPPSFVPNEAGGDAGGGSREGGGGGGGGGGGRERYHTKWVA